MESGGAVDPAFTVGRLSQHSHSEVLIGVKTPLNSQKSVRKSEIIRFFKHDPMLGIPPKTNHEQDEWLVFQTEKLMTRGNYVGWRIESSINNLFLIMKEVT